VVYQNVHNMNWNAVKWRQRNIRMERINPIEMEQARRKQEINSAIINSISQSVPLYNGELIRAELDRQAQNYREHMAKVQREFMFNEIHSSGAGRMIYTSGADPFEPCGVSEVIAPTEFELDTEVTKYSISDGNSRKFRYTNNQGAIMSMEATPFPHCCGICILHNFSFDKDVTQEQFNKYIFSIVEVLKSDDSYGKILVYTSNYTGNHRKLFENYPSVSILDTFRNPRTGNILSGFEIDIIR